MSEATSGMTHDYDDHSAYQRAVAQTGEQLVRASVEAIGPVEGAFTVVDYGSGTGANAVRIVRVALEAYRAIDPTTPMVAVHNDLATNDWNQLFADVGADGGYDAIGDVVPMASATSFFERAAAPRSVHVGLSANAAHWFRRRPDVVAPGCLYFDRATGEAAATLADLAAADWARFLERRAEELVVGGHLVVQCVGSIVDGGTHTRQATAGRLLDVMFEVASSMVADGSLDQDALDRYVLPVYARTEEEARAPFAAGSELDAAYEVLHIGTAAVPSPYEAELERSGDAAAYADAYVGFVRGFTESTLHEGLFEPGSTDPERAEVDFYRRLHDRFASEPGVHAFDDWTLTVWLRRR